MNRTAIMGYEMGLQRMMKRDERRRGGDRVDEGEAILAVHGCRTTGIAPFRSMTSVEWGGR